MRVLITGGSGLIGRALAKNLLVDGHDVIILSRSFDHIIPLPEGVKLVKWDAKTTHGWGHLVDGTTAIVNLAGASMAGDGFFPTRWTLARQNLISTSRVNASNAVNASVENANAKPRVVVQASAIGYYGYHDDELLTEQSPPGNDWGATFTAEVWEPSTLPVESLGVRRVTVRSGVVFSTDGGALPRLLLPFRLFVGGPMGSGRQWYSWIHIHDQVRALRFLIESNEAKGAFNLTAPQPEQNGEIAKLIGKMMRRPAIIPVPGFALKLAFGAVADVVLKGQRVLPHRLLEHGFSFFLPFSGGRPA